MWWRLSPTVSSRLDSTKRRRSASGLPKLSIAAPRPRTGRSGPLSRAHHSGGRRAASHWQYDRHARDEGVDGAIRIFGKDILQAAIAGKQTKNGNVRGFVRKWRARNDSNVRPSDS